MGRGRLCGGGRLAVFARPTLPTAAAAAPALSLPPRASLLPPTTIMLAAWRAAVERRHAASLAGALRAASAAPAGARQALDDRLAHERRMTGVKGEAIGRAGGGGATARRIPTPRPSSLD